MFYCRNNELRKMEKKYQDGAFECIVIYGRRRVGKTALINAFCKGKKSIYFSALDTTPRENLRALSKAIYGYENSNTAMAPEYSSFDDALAKISQLAKEERVIFGGRLGEYKYYDMDAVIAAALELCEREMK